MDEALPMGFIGRGLALTAHPRLAQRLKKSIAIILPTPSVPSWQVIKLTLL